MFFFGHEIFLLSMEKCQHFSIFNEYLLQLAMRSGCVSSQKPKSHSHFKCFINEIDFLVLAIIIFLPFKLNSKMNKKMYCKIERKKMANGKLLCFSSVEIIEKDPFHCEFILVLIYVFFFSLFISFYSFQPSSCHANRNTLTDEGIEIVLTVMEAKELIGPPDAEQFDTFVRIYMVPDETVAQQTKVCHSIPFHLCMSVCTPMLCVMMMGAKTNEVN